MISLRKRINIYFKNLIREIILEQNDTPEFKTISKNNLVKKKNLDVYSVMLNFQVTKITLSVKYIDPNSGTSKIIWLFTDDTCELKKSLQNYVPEYDFFSRISLNIKFIHPDFGNSECFDIIVDYYDEVCKSKEIHKFINPIIEFIDDHPELLI